MPENTENYEEELKKLIDAYSEDLSRFIDESFLKKVFRELLGEHRFYELMKRDEYITGRRNFFYDVCVNIAMVHWFNCIALTKNEIEKKYNDESYLYQLKNDVIEQCKLGVYLRDNKNDIFYSHIPVFLSCHTIIQEGENQLSQYIMRVKEVSLEKDKKEFYNFLSFHYMFNTADSVLLLLEDDDINNAYTLLRTLIEMLYVYLAIFNNDEAIDEYERFFDWRLLNEEGKDCPEDFEREFGKRRWKNKAFLNYGWLHILEKDMPLDKIDYTFVGVFSHSQIDSAKADPIWTKMYMKCCKYVHGNPIGTTDPKKDFFEISSFLSSILINIGDIFTSIMEGISFEYEGIYLIGHLKTEKEKLENTWERFNSRKDKQDDVGKMRFR